MRNQSWETWGKGTPCYMVAQNLAELRSSVLWKVEFLNAEILRQDRPLMVVEKMAQSMSEGRLGIKKTN